MYKRIVLAVDLAEPAPTPKGLEQALELTKASGGELRLVNVQPVIPARSWSTCRPISTKNSRSAQRKRSTPL